MQATHAAGSQWISSLRIIPVSKEKKEKKKAAMKDMEGENPETPNQLLFYHVSPGLTAVLPVPHCDDQVTSVFSLPSRNQMLLEKRHLFVFLQPFEWPRWSPNLKHIHLTRSSSGL